MALPPFHVHPEVFLLFGSIAAAFLIWCRRHEAETGEVTERRKKVMFLSGVAVLWLGATWPIHDLAERYLFSVHMVQHMMFTLVAAPLLVAGSPAWMLRRMLHRPSVRRVFRFLTRPLMALIIYNGVLLFTHWPEIVKLAVTSEPIHFALHVLIVASALIMWWPVLSPLPEMPPLPAPGQMLYLFFQSLAPTIPASFLTFGHHPLYPIYETFPRIWGIGPMADQLMAGLIMKLVGGMILWVVIGVVFFRWYGREQRSDLDSLQYRNVDREIQAELNR